MQRFDKLRLSIRSQNHLGNLKHKTKIPINVLARFGICLSFNDPSIPNVAMYDEKGMELAPHILFGKHELVFSVLLQDRLRQDKLNYDKYANSMIRAHTNRGAGMLFTRVNKLSDFANMLKTDAV